MVSPQSPECKQVFKTSTPNRLKILYNSPQLEQQQDCGSTEAMTQLQCFTSQLRSIGDHQKRTVLRDKNSQVSSRINLATSEQFSPLVVGLGLLGMSGLIASAPWGRSTGFLPLCTGGAIQQPKGVSASPEVILVGAMRTESVLLHCSNPKCKRWERFLDPLSLDGLPMICGLCGHRLVRYSPKPKKRASRR